jgi:Ca2+-binding RTX toxin-like protein
MGFTYAGASGQARLTPLDAGSGGVAVSLALEQVASISLAYERFKTDIYESLLIETRLKHFYDLIEVGFIADKPIYYFANIEASFAQAIQNNPLQGIVDLVEFMSAFGEVKLGMLGWNAKDFLLNKLANAPTLGAFSEELSSWTVRFLGTGEGAVIGSTRADLMVGTAGADTIDGRDGADILFGGAGDDFIAGGLGNDTIDGGAGNDTITDFMGANFLKGGAGADSIRGSGTIEGGVGDDVLTAGEYWSGDTYIFNLGDGKDVIVEYGASNEQGHSGPGMDDTLQFGPGIAVSAVALSRVGNDLVFKVNANDQVTMKDWYLSGYGLSNGSRYLEKVLFADGTVWTTNTIRGMAIAMTGTGNADSITGWDGKDVIDAGAGNDTIDGGAGADSLVGGLGDDSILGGLGNDTINGGSGNDTINDFSGANSIKGGAGVDTITGSGTIEGGTGDDVIVAGEYFSGDTYIFNPGDGKDTIAEYGTSNALGTPGSGMDDTLQFGAGIVAAAVILSRSGNDLVFKVNASDQVAMKDWFFTATGAGHRYLERVLFADGTFWTTDTIRAMTISTLGTANADSIIGWDGKDVIDTGAGNDTVDGGAGADSILGGLGDDSLSGGLGNDSIDAGDGNDTINDFIGTNALKGGLGADTITGSGTMTGGAGDDLLIAGEYFSGDTYIFNLGDGKDTIAEYGASNALGIPGPGMDDTLQFGAGIVAATVSLSRSGNDLVFAVNTSDQVTMKDWYLSGIGSGYGYRFLEKVQFADGTIWTTDTIRAMAIPASGTAGADSILGWDGKDVIDGGAGNDTIDGGAGADTLTGFDGFDLIYGGDGDDNINGGLNGDTLYGGNGNDFIGGGQGLDRIDGGEGNDTIIGGLGTDTLTGGSGADRFSFKHALDGVTNIDTITDYTSGQDVIELSASIFTAFSGQIGSYVAPSAYLTYNSATGVLAYDADGAGAGAPITFAILGTVGHPTLLGSDFLIVA